MTLRCLRVGAEAELGAARRDERRRELHPRDRAHEVDVRTRLDLDHLGAVLRQATAHLHAHRADPEVHDPHARERRAGIGPRRRRRRARRAQRREHVLGVLADGRWRRLRAGAAAVDLEEACEHRCRHAVGQLHRRERAARCEVLVGEHTRRWERGRAHDPASLRLRRRLVHPELGEVLVEQWVDHRGCDHEARHEVVQLGIAQVLGIADPLAQRTPLSRAQDDETYVPVLALEHRVHRTGPVTNLRGRLPRDHTRAHVGECPVGAQRDRFVRRQLDELAGADLLTLVERAQRHERGGDRHEVVDEVTGREERGAVGHAGLERDPARGREHRIGCDVVGERTVEPVHGDRERDQVRVTPRQLTQVEVARQGHLRGDEHVGVPQELLEPVAVGAGVEVERHPELARVADGPGERHARPDGGEGAGRRSAGRLDLHHLGAEVAEQAGRELAALDGAVDDPEPREGQFAGHGPTAWHSR